MALCSPTLGASSVWLPRSPLSRSDRATRYPRGQTAPPCRAVRRAVPRGVRGTSAGALCILSGTDASAGPPRNLLHRSDCTLHSPCPRASLLSVQGAVSPCMLRRVFKIVFPLCFRLSGGGTPCGRSQVCGEGVDHGGLQPGALPNQTRSCTPSPCRAARRAVHAVLVGQFSIGSRGV